MSSETEKLPGVKERLLFCTYIKDAVTPPATTPESARSHNHHITCADYGEAASLNQILALAARIERMLDDQEFRMRLAEEKRVERLKRRYSKFAMKRAA